jgi:DNA-binding transcriptional MocR family regulator
LKTIQDENLPIWLPRLAVYGGPRYLQIADALQAAVVDVARAADSEGIAVTPAEAFAPGSGSVNAIRISLGSIKDRGRLGGSSTAVSSACAAA